MALLDLVPTSPAIQAYQGEGQNVKLTCLNSAGANVTMSGLNAYRIKVFQSGGSGAASPFLSDTTAGHFTGAAGSLTYALSATDVNAIPPGSFSYVVEVQNGVSDDFQQVAVGTFICRVAG